MQQLWSEIELLANGMFGEHSLMVFFVFDTAIRNKFFLDEILALYAGTCRGFNDVSGVSMFRAGGQCGADECSRC